MDSSALFKNILSNIQNNNYDKIEFFNNEIIINDFINNLNNYSTLSIILIHQYLSKYQKDYHQQVVKSILHCNFDDSNINLVIITKNIFEDSCGVSFQENIEEFITLVVKFGRLLCNIYVNEQIFDKMKQIVCFEILDLFNHICEEAVANIILDSRFIEMISEIFTNFTSSKYVFNNARYNIHAMIKLLKKCHDLLNLHDDALYAQILMSLLFDPQDINKAQLTLLNGNISSFMKSLTDKCKHSMCEDETRKWLSIFRKIILLYLDWICSIIQDIHNSLIITNSLFLLSKVVSSLNKTESITKEYVALFVGDDGKLMKLLAYNLVIEDDSKCGHLLFRNLDLMLELIEKVSYDVELIYQWLRDYDDFKDVFCHFLKELQLQEKFTYLDELLRFMKAINLRWKEYTKVENELETALNLFLKSNFIIK